MGHVLTVPEEEFGVEGRSESFYVYPSNKVHRVQNGAGVWEDGKPFRWIVVYPHFNEDDDSGSIELMYKDIPAMRRALDRAEAYQKERDGS